MDDPTLNRNFKNRKEKKVEKGMKKLKQGNTRGKKCQSNLPEVPNHGQKSTSLQAQLKSFLLGAPSKETVNVRQDFN